MMKRTKALAFSSKSKMETSLLVELDTQEHLSLAYTPGIAEVSRLIEKSPEKMFDYTFRKNSLAVISNGTAVLGLGNVGHKASYPVMEGKAMLFKRFAKIDAIPIVLDTEDVDAFVHTVKHIADSFAAINLEDIAAPKCFEIEEKLKTELEIPVMHDDQHGTAVVVLAAVINALKLTGKDNQVKIVVSGSGAAGIAITRMLLNYGFEHIVKTDSKGVLGPHRKDLFGEKYAIMKRTNPLKLDGQLEHALQEADVFIGVSKGGIVSQEMIKNMNSDPVIIAMANPAPEIMPDQALEAGAGLVATGRSDFVNQVNNALVFPGIFRAAIDARVKISEEMKLAAAQAIVRYHQDDLAFDNLLPSILDGQVHEFIAKSVYSTAKK